MSNPTTLVSAFNDSLAYTDPSGAGAWTGVDPIRYSSGLYLEDATTNLITNPSFETNTTTWAVAGVASVIAFSTDFAKFGTQSLKVTAGAGASYAQRTSLTLAVATHWASAWVYNAAAASRSFVLRYNGSNFVTLAVAPGAWTQLSGQFTGTGTSLSFLAGASDSSAGELFYIDGVAIEQRAYATSYTDGAQGTGYAWTGTAHASTSTRAASSASVATASHISPTSGSLAFRFTRKIDTSGTETILECGTDGAGTDYLSIYVNSSDKLVVSWKSNGAAAQTVTSTGSIAVDTEYLVITKWNGTSVSLSLNVGTPNTGTRDAVQGSWGAGALKLKASAGGAIFNGLLVANRPTTQIEDSTLYRRPVWSFGTLKGNAFTSFQLRPY